LVRDVDIEMVPTEAARLPTEWECPSEDVAPTYVWVCPLAAVWLEYVAVVVWFVA
jgi:hypothetical protein